MEDKKALIKQGWLRALIYFVCIFFIMLLFQGVGFLIIKKLGILNEKNNEESILNFGLIYAFMGVGIFAFTFLMRKFVDRKSFVSLGFNWKGYTNEAALGLFSAGALLGVGSLILVVLGYITFLSFSINESSLLVELLAMIVVAFVEEVLFRGYLLNNLLQSMNKWVALIISAVLFAFVHCSNPDVTIIAIVNIFLAGIFLGLNYIFTKNLWFSILFHFAWNFLQGPILGYDVSGLKLQPLFQQSLTGPEPWTGGPFGFEGSLLCPILFGLSIVGLAYSFSKQYEITTTSKKAF